MGGPSTAGLNELRELLLHPLRDLRVVGRYVVFFARVGFQVEQRVAGHLSVFQTQWLLLGFNLHPDKVLLSYWHLRVPPQGHRHRSAQQPSHHPARHGHLTWTAQTGGLPDSGDRQVAPGSGGANWTGLERPLKARPEGNRV